MHLIIPQLLYIGHLLVYSDTASKTNSCKATICSWNSLYMSKQNTDKKAQRSINLCQLQQFFVMYKQHYENLSKLNTVSMMDFYLA